MIKKLFYRFEAEQRLCEVALHPGGKSIDIDFAAECFVHEAAFHPCSQAGPGEYRAIMALDPRVKDGGRDSAFVVLVASTAPDIQPDDRDFILAEHRDLARLWFTDKPQVYFGLLKLDIAINEALGFEADDDQKMRDVLEQQYMDAKTYRIRYAEQGAKATQDLCAFKKYQEAA